MEETKQPKSDKKIKKNKINKSGIETNLSTMQKKQKVASEINKKFPFVKQFAGQNFDAKEYVESNLQETNSKKVKSVYKDLEEKEQILNSEITEQLFQHYKTFIKAYDNMMDIEHGLKEFQAQLSQYGISIENLRQ